jgi:hypothetical protein
MPEQKFPVIILCRAAQTQRRWSDDGELVRDDGDEAFVPPYVVALFKDCNERCRSDACSWMTDSRYFHLDYVNGRNCISLSKGPLESVPNAMADEELERSSHRFALLMIVLRAFPDQYSSITWEEDQSLISDTIETVSLPFL